jgi:hypothetical protein
MPIALKGEIMKNFLLNWNFKKQIVAETLGYGSIAIIGNILLGKCRSSQEKAKNPKQLVQQMPKKQKYFNGVVLSCFIADATASYFLLKYIKEKLGE